MMPDTATMRRGFTLIELLIVISVISALAAMVTVGVGIARTMASKAKAHSLIAKVTAAITSSRQVIGYFPGEKETYTAGDPNGPASLWPDLFPRSSPGPGPFSNPSNNTASDQDGFWQSVDARLLFDLRKGGDNSLPNDLSDPWGHPLRYRPARSYPFQPTTTSPTPAAIDSQTPPNQDTFQVWSSGPDGIDQGGEAGSDDLRNW